jgi:hypothetical protein
MTFWGLGIDSNEISIPTNLEKLELFRSECLEHLVDLNSIQSKIGWSSIGCAFIWGGKFACKLLASAASSFISIEVPQRTIAVKHAVATESTSRFVVNENHRDFSSIRPSIFVGFSIVCAGREGLGVCNRQVVGSVDLKVLKIDCSVSSQVLHKFVIQGQRVVYDVFISNRGRIIARFVAKCRSEGILSV